MIRDGGFALMQRKASVTVEHQQTDAMKVDNATSTTASTTTTTNSSTSTSPPTSPPLEAASATAAGFLTLVDAFCLIRAPTDVDRDNDDDDLFDDQPSTTPPHAVANVASVVIVGGGGGGGEHRRDKSSALKQLWCELDRNLSLLAQGESSNRSTD
jgi:hypothetical protein